MASPPRPMASPPPRPMASPPRTMVKRKGGARKSRSTRKNSRRNARR
jgi:hypothetical protein